MRRLVMALALTLGLASPSLAQYGTVTIGDDFGGSVFTYAHFFKRLEDARVPVRVDGLCISACTLVLSLPNDQLCVTPRASFGFHLASIEGKADKDLTVALIHRFYPTPLQEWLSTKHLTLERVIYLSAHEAAKLGIVRICN